MNNLKKYLAKAGVVAVIGAIGIGASSAYFTDTEKVENKFTIGDVDVDFGEPEWNPDPNSEFPDGDGKNMYPGYAVYKNPTVENVTKGTGSKDGIYTRMVVKITDSVGNAITDKAALELIKQTIRFDRTYNGNLQTKGEAVSLKQGMGAGYYLKDLKDIPTVNPDFSLDTGRSTDNTLVYNYMGKNGDGKLHTGEQSALFTTIVIPADWSQEELDKIRDFNLNIISESIQSGGFVSQNDAYHALDKEMESK